MEGVDKLEQGLIRLLAIKARQYRAQVQQGRLKGCFQHEAGRCAGDQGTLVIVSNLDGDGLLVLGSMAGACWGKHHLQPPRSTSQYTSSACCDPLHVCNYTMDLLMNSMWRAACTGLSEASCPKQQAVLSVRSGSHAEPLVCSSAAECCRRKFAHGRQG